MKRLLGSFLVYCLSLSLAFALSDFYTFQNPIDQKRFESLTQELRCLVCQNQNIAESNAPLANDLRNQIFAQINAGKSDEDILGYLTQRYGDFILYHPPLKTSTYLLWFLPFMILFIGILALFCYLYRNQRGRSC